MTIATSVRTAGPYTGTGLVSVYAFAFKVFQASDLLVSRTNVDGSISTLALSSDYSVSLSANQDSDPGGSIILVSPLAVGYSLSITSNIPATQPAALQNSGGFFPKVIEAALDRLTILFQQAGLVGAVQALRVPEIGGIPVLPSAADRAGRVQAYDSLGNPLLIAGVDSASAAALALDLANSASRSKGAGLVGFTRAGVNVAARMVMDKLDEFVSITDFAGADKTGAGDSTAALVNAAAASQTVYIPPGTFTISQAAIPSNTMVFGCGPASILKQKAGSAQFNSVLAVVGRTGVTVRDLQIDGNGNSIQVGEHNHGIQIADSTDVAVRNITVHDCNGDAIYIASTTNSILCRRVAVTGCTVYNLGRQGICVAEYGARNVLIEGNHGRVGTYVATSTSHGNPIHLELDSQPSVYVGDITIRGNVLNEMGISIGGNYSNVTITGNTIRGGAFTGTFGLIGLVNPLDVSITGNTLIGDNLTNLGGIYLQDAGTSGAASVKNIVISGNTIEQVAGNGIELVGTSPGVPSLGRVIISGNVLDTIGTGGGKTGIAVTTAFPDLQVVDNTIKTVTNIGITVQACANFIVAGNMVSEFAGSYGIYLATQGGTGAGPGTVSGNTVSHSTPAGKTGIRVENEATNTRISIFGNDCAGTAAPINIGASAVKCRSWANVTGNDSPVGSFTLGAAALTTVNNANVLAGSRIILTPTNAVAAALMGSAKALYVSARTAGTSFGVTTANAAAAAGTETFDYWISS